MFKIFLTLFILVPIVEIAVFIQVGGLLGPGLTIIIVIITAVLGVNLLKQQGFKAWRDIQQSTLGGQIPALEMASAAQLLFAGGLLLTPGFVTDIIGFLLMVPSFRLLIAKHFIRNITTVSNSSRTTYQFSNSYYKTNETKETRGRIIDGECESDDFERKNKEQEKP